MRTKVYRIPLVASTLEGLLLGMVHWVRGHPAEADHIDDVTIHQERDEWFCWIYLPPEKPL